jgi:hypothetical protein
VTPLRTAAALAALVAAASVSAFVRTRDDTTGKVLSWPVRTVPWHLNRDWPNTSNTCQATGGVDRTLDAVRASFAEWQQSCTDLSLLYAGTLAEIRTGFGGAADNVVVFRHGWCSRQLPANEPCMLDPDVDCGGIYNCFEDGCPPQGCSDWNIVALTSVLYDPDTGRILDADIELNGWDGGGTETSLPQGQPPNGWYFTCGDVATTPCTTYGEGDCRFMDLRNTLTHEVGHFVGLAHVPDHLPIDPENTWPTMEKTTTAGETSKRSLAPDDIAGVCAIYPDQGGDGGCGCGSGGAAGALALALAALALRRPGRGRRATRR